MTNQRPTFRRGMFAARCSPRALGLLCAVVIAGCGTGKGSREDAARPGVPPEVAKASREWPLPGRDYNNSRFTQDSSINSANVSQLGEAWRFELSGIVIAFGMLSTAPLIVDGTVYVEDMDSSVYAIELATGRARWKNVTVDVSTGPNGVAVGWGKVFAVSGSFSVVAYDAATGRQLWLKRVVDTATDGIDIQPTVFDGQVLISTVPISTAALYRAGDRGILKALDQSTGEETWRFDTVKDEDFWGNASVNSGGGAWFPPAIDLDTGRVFWAVANPAPFPGTSTFPNAQSRAGDNLYTNSTLALDARTGEYQWHHQTAPHDLFDRDLLHTMLAVVNGVPVVVSTGKEGRVWANRRDTGEVLWGPVPVGMHVNDELTALDGPTRVLPGGFGGVLTPPALADGVAYVAALNAGTLHQPDGMKSFATEMGTISGNLVAIDVKTGNVVWDVAVDGDPTGGVTVINDLVVTATYQGDVIAFERAGGKEVWRWRAPGGINSWLSVSGDTLIVPVGMSNPAAIVALKLGATGNRTPVEHGGAGNAGTLPATPDQDPETFSSIYTQILAKKCAGAVCHSGDAADGAFRLAGVTSASALHASLIDHAATGSQCAASSMSLVVPGNPDSSLLYRKLTASPPCGSRMPPTALSANEIENVRAWIANGALDN